MSMVNFIALFSIYKSADERCTSIAAQLLAISVEIKEKQFLYEQNIFCSELSTQEIKGKLQEAEEMQKAILDISSELFAVCSSIEEFNIFLLKQISKSRLTLIANNIDL